MSITSILSIQYWVERRIQSRNGPETKMLGNEKQAKKRAKWVLPLAKMPVYEAIDWIERASPSEIRSAIAAMESCSATNCWWGEFATANVLMPYIKTHGSRLAVPAASKKRQ